MCTFKQKNTKKGKAIMNKKIMFANYANNKMQK